jgi:phosphoribosylanthranilate isomerase
MFVKICGMTCLADALHAADQGADAVGFVFWPRSPRYVAPARAAEIIGRLPRHVTAVGVFVNAAIDDVRDVAAQTGIAMVQLHGDEDPSFASAVGRPVMKAIGVEHGDEALDGWPGDTMFLVDAVDPVQRGGTGMRVDWPRAAHIARRRRIVLAGGLTDANVAEAVSTVRPFGVDVSSGVEDAPGVKNHDKVARFLAGARSAFEQHEIWHR